MHALILVPFAVFGVILGVLAYVLKRRRSQYPDCSTGYHHKRAMESRENWERANNAAAWLCALFCTATLLTCALLYFTGADKLVAIAVLFALSAAAVVVILTVPIKLLGKD